MSYQRGPNENPCSRIWNPIAKGECCNETELSSGGILASISAVMGVVGHFILFMNWYHIGMAAPSAEPGCEILLKYIHPLLADFGIFAAVLFAVSAYGFFTKQNWAFFLSVIGIVLALLASWFIKSRTWPPAFRRCTSHSSGRT
jgi:FtsH-binding integral membrane protein